MPSRKAKYWYVSVLFGYDAFKEGQVLVCISLVWVRCLQGRPSIGMYQSCLGVMPSRKAKYWYVSVLFGYDAFKEGQVLVCISLVRVRCLQGRPSIGMYQSCSGTMPSRKAKYWYVSVLFGYDAFKEGQVLVCISLVRVRCLQGRPSIGMYQSCSGTMPSRKAKYWYVSVLFGYDAFKEGQVLVCISLVRVRSLQGRPSIGMIMYQSCSGTKPSRKAKYWYDYVSVLFGYEAFKEGQVLVCISLVFIPAAGLSTLLNS